MRPLLFILLVVLVLLTVWLVAEAVEVDDDELHGWGYVTRSFVIEPPPTTTVVPRARTAPTVRSRSAGRPARVGDPPDSDFDRLAQCESGGNWSANTGNGYYGGLQFDAETWRAYGGAGFAHEHPREVQISVARTLWRARGWQPWPVCSRRVGLRA